MNKETLQRIEDLLREEATREGIELVSVRFFVDSLNGPTLEVLVDHDYQITMDEISAFTEKASPLLDSLPELEESYLLDISSGGGEKLIPFDDLAKLIGHYIDVRTKDGRKTTMKLEGVQDGKAQFVYFIKGRRKKEVLGPEDIDSMKMGYKA
ncbi:MAG TPA: hypothetical protein IAC60_01715 [Candidatus Enterosoma merdigallinarum]|nr:hypothetical protein [Candidatus Enterosoma merdigallinarum]